MFNRGPDERDREAASGGRPPEPSGRAVDSGSSQRFRALPAGPRERARKRTGA